MLGKKVISQSLIYGLASVLVNGSNFFLIPLYTHYLPPAEYGIISSVTVFSTFSTAILAFGLNGAVTRLYFEYSSEDFRKFLFSVFTFQVLAAFFIVSVFLLSGGIFLDKIFRNVAYDPFLKYGVIIGFTGIFSSIPLAFLQAQSKALTYRVFTTTSFVALTLLMVLFIVVLQKGGLGGIQATLFANSLMAIVYTVFMLKTAKFHFDFTYVKVALYFSLPLMVYAIFGTVTEISSKYFIERYISLSQLGVFNVAQQIAALIVLITNAINMAWIPIFYAEAGRDEQSGLFSLFGNFFIFLLVFAGLGLSMLSRDFVSGFMSSEYLESAQYIPYLILAYVVGNGYWTLLINPLTFSKKTIFLPALTILSGIFSIGLNITLIPSFGLVGAAVSTCISYGILVLVTYFIFRKHSAVIYNFKTINSMVLCGVFIYILSLQFSTEYLWVNIGVKFVLMVFYLVILKVFKIYSFDEAKRFFKSQSSKQ